MQKSSCLFFFIGISICSIAASKEAAVYPLYPDDTTIYHHQEGKSLERLMLQLGDESLINHTNTIRAIKDMNLPHAHILFRWSRFARSDDIGLNTGTVGPELFHFARASVAVYRLVDVSKALEGLFRVIKVGTSHQATHARQLVTHITEKLRNSMITPDPGAVSLLTASLHDPHPEVCQYAAEILRHIDPAYTKDAVPALFHALGNENGRVRFEAVSTLGPIAAAHPDIQSETSDKLIAILSDAPFDVYRHRGLYDTLHTTVADALVSVGPAAVPFLLDALNTTDPDVRHNAAIALARIDSDLAEKTIPVLAESFLSSSHLTRTYAVSALETLALAQPTFTAEIVSILKNRPKSRLPRWVPESTWDYAADPDLEYRFHQRARAALERISAAQADTARDND